MRKAEFKTKAEKVTITRYNKIQEKGFNFYKSQQYRWEETADPVIDDVEYHLTLDQAIETADKISLDIGFEAQVERIFIPYDDFNENIEFRDIFDLSDLDSYKRFNAERETVYNGKTNEGDNLDGAILVEWSWERYVGYCRNCHSLRFGNSSDTESSIISGNEEMTFRHNLSVLLTAKEIEGLDDEDIAELIYNELDNYYWKWNYFNKVRKSDLVTMVCDLSTLNEEIED